MRKQIILYSLRNTMPSGDNVKPIDQSAAASAGSDTYVSLSKQETVLNNEFETQTKESRVASCLTCHGKLPKPASSPPTILLCAICFETTGMPQPAKRNCLDSRAIKVSPFIIIAWLSGLIIWRDELR